MTVQSRLAVWTCVLPEPLNTAIGIVAAVLLFVILLFNSVTFVVFARTPALRQFGDYFILNLAMSNFGIGVITMPICLRILLSESQSAKLWHCLYWFAFEASAVALTAYSMCIISIDRYLAVSRPSWYQRYKTDRLRTLMVLTPWFIAASVFLSFALLSRFMVTNSHVVTDETCWLPYHISTTLFSFVSVVDFMVPFACLLVLNVLMYVHIHDRSQMEVLSSEIKIKAPTTVINQGVSEDQAQTNELSSVNFARVSSSLYPATCYSDTTSAANSTCFHSPEKNFGFSCLSFRLCPFAKKGYPSSSSRHSGASKEDVSFGSSPTHETAAKRKDTSDGFLGHSVVGEENVVSSRFLSSPAAKKESVASRKAKVSTVSFQPNKVDKEGNVSTPSSCANPVAAKQSATSSLRRPVRFPSDGNFCAGSSRHQWLSVDVSDTCELHRNLSKRSLKSCKKVAAIELFLRKRKMARSLLVLVLVFAFCWVPTEVLSLVQLVCLTCVDHWVFYISFWMIRLNSVLNPVLYVVLHKRYRNALRNMLRKERKVIPASETI